MSPEFITGILEEEMKEISQVSTLIIIQAQQLVEQGLPQEALYLLKGELSKNPNSRLVLYYIGLTQRALNDFDEAEQSYLKALTSKEDENVVFPNLKGYQFMGAPEDGIYCQLRGIPGTHAVTRIIAKIPVTRI